MKYKHVPARTQRKGEKSFALPSPRRNRRSIRLKGYDYSQAGAYFITVCTHNREYLFGEVADGTLQLNAAGEIARQCWEAIPVHFPNVSLDEFMIMPNHIHGIILINECANDRDGGADDGGAKNAGAKNAGAKNAGAKNAGAKNFSPQRNEFRSPSRTVGSVVRGFKIGVTKWFRKNKNLYTTTWQRNYYEHIVRNEADLNRIRAYIIGNPLKWCDDKKYSSSGKNHDAGPEKRPNRL